MKVKIGVLDYFGTNSVVNRVIEAYQPDPERLRKGYKDERKIFINRGDLGSQRVTADDFRPMRGGTDLKFAPAGIPKSIVIARETTFVPGGLTEDHKLIHGSFFLREPFGRSGVDEQEFSRYLMVDFAETREINEDPVEFPCQLDELIHKRREDLTFDNSEWRANEIGLFVQAIDGGEAYPEAKLGSDITAAAFARSFRDIDALLRGTYWAMRKAGRPEKTWAEAGMHLAEHYKFPIFTFFRKWAERLDTQGFGGHPFNWK